MQYECIRTPEGFAALRPEWDGLLAASANNEIFLTWEWLHTWWGAYHPGDLFIWAARDERGVLVGLAPYFIDLSDPAERVVRPIGCVDVTDYLDLIYLPAVGPDFCAGLAAQLAAHRAEFDRINLCNLCEVSPTKAILPPALEAAGFVVNIKGQEVCPVITLPTTFEGYLEALDKKQRHESRRKLRRAEANEDDRVGWYIVGPQHDLTAELERFLQLMAASHPDKAEFLQDAKNAAFFRAVMPQIAACGWLQLSFLTVNDEPAATYLNFDYGNRIQVYNSGLQPEKFAHLSPGIVLLLYNIRHAIEQGRKEFDFLRGNEEYKYRMGGRDRAVLEVQAR